LKLGWSRLARTDRDTIFDHISLDSLRAAVAVDELIRSKVELLIQYPQSGRSGRVDGTRELVISGTPYIASYRIEDDRIRILRILHGAQQWPEDMPD
jgi:toxin ParE1/3/4